MRELALMFLAEIAEIIEMEMLVTAYIPLQDLFVFMYEEI